ncbi:hypothetical protein CFE70_002695 [Pyrenophora teres f. teres 0-1]|uniref:Uncharacterized protein n=2 Tax=Pyrenophora teres f. teres TaxID=97479 RepID=E3RHE2_PYRTT|nr:hypothetical protein PTT_07320 [Pyrenophora teres f. teres 0-1]KAE8843250.1 hypothetical protein HRS9139_02547 [Pyrenophora teres f. teres]KAE8849694.1 hypothetical protein PTNB85_00110 [Pyrenophora teres f. teres]KAE8852279.1 hypothetical protein HRS9122_02566 [Pyrenophora teres f. teres]KAE8870950.1 hypothetical protein PTNB29_01294 [Pyrenophora teres f. teres]
MFRESINVENACVDSNQLKYVCRTFHGDVKGRTLFFNDITFQRHTEEQPSALAQFNAFLEQCSESNKRLISTVYLRSKIPNVGSYGDASEMSIPDDLPLPVSYPLDIALFQNIAQYCLDFPRATVLIRLNGFADGNNKISYRALGKIYWIITFLCGGRITWPYECLQEPYEWMRNLKPMVPSLPGNLRFMPNHDTTEGDMSAQIAALSSLRIGQELAEP